MTILWNGKRQVIHQLETMLVEINAINWEMICIGMDEEARSIKTEAFDQQDNWLAKRFQKHNCQFFGLTEREKHEIHLRLFKDSVELITEDQNSLLKRLLHTADNAGRAYAFLSSSQWTPPLIRDIISLELIEEAAERARLVHHAMMDIEYYQDFVIEPAKEDLIPLLEEIRVSGTIQ